ncbi:hypothetical protein ACIU1J_11300 [Azospirillum doebereinerae]|uniref:hypothetical protein n=1 Tax=Azospirillum doebereinerae TaxID=92933 RepID=UPI00384AF9B1
MQAGDLGDVLSQEVGGFEVRDVTGGPLAQIHDQRLGVFGTVAGADPHARRVRIRATEIRQQPPEIRTGPHEHGHVCVPVDHRPAPERLVVCAPSQRYDFPACRVGDVGQPAGNPAGLLAVVLAQTAHLYGSGRPDPEVQDTHGAAGGALVFHERGDLRGGFALLAPDCRVVDWPTAERAAPALRSLALGGEVNDGHLVVALPRVEAGGLQAGGCGLVLLPLLGGAGDSRGGSTATRGAKIKPVRRADNK